MSKEMHKLNKLKLVYETLIKSKLNKDDTIDKLKQLLNDANEIKFCFDTVIDEEYRALLNFKHQLKKRLELYNLHKKLFYLLKQCAVSFF